MAYQIDKTDGTTLVQLLDGVVDTSTDLKLVGRNVSGYGDAQNENFVRLLENFAKADTPPGKPLIGQLWFDKNADKMRPSVFDGVRWRNMGIVDVAPVTNSHLHLKKVICGGILQTINYTDGQMTVRLGYLLVLKVLLALVKLNGKQMY